MDSYQGSVSLQKWTCFPVQMDNMTLATGLGVTSYNAT